MDKKKVYAAGFKRGVEIREEYGPNKNVSAYIDQYWPPAVMYSISGGHKFGKYRDGLPSRGSKIRKELEILWNSFGNGFVDGYYLAEHKRGVERRRHKVR